MEVPTINHSAITSASSKGITRSFSGGIRMFGTSMRSKDAQQPSTRSNSSSRDLGCCITTAEDVDYNSIRKSSSSVVSAEEEDTIFMQLEEGGLFDDTTFPVHGTKSDVITTTGSYFPFQRNKKQQQKQQELKVDRSDSNQSMDPDHFLWNDENVVPPTTSNTSTMPK